MICFKVLTRSCGHTQDIFTLASLQFHCMPKLCINLCWIISNTHFTWQFMFAKVHQRIHETLQIAAHSAYELPLIYFPTHEFDWAGPFGPLQWYSVDCCSYWTDDFQHFHKTNRKYIFYSMCKTVSSVRFPIRIILIPSRVPSTHYLLE